jgi:gamma-carbonic anhydrase
MSSISDPAASNLADPFRRPQPEWPRVAEVPPPLVPYPEVHWSWDGLRTQPLTDRTAFIAPGSTVYGRVRMQARSSVWFGCVIRGDHEWIDIGEDTNIQDGSILHVDPGYPCLIGNRVTLAHRTLVHASVVEDDVMIAIGATVLSRCVIGAGSLIAAGAVVMEGVHVPPGTLWAGCPARQLKTVSPDLAARMKRTWQHYVNNAAAHRAALQ